MRYLLFILYFISFAGEQEIFAQRTCGLPAVKAAIIARNPAAAEEFETQRRSLQNVADSYTKTIVSARKSTTSSAIPVIFHVVVTNAQFDMLGGISGIAQRCDSQIAVLERDFNKMNDDSALIPASWKPLYGSAGIHFGLAHTNPVGWNTPGYELRIIPDTTFFFAGNGGYEKAKHEATGGLDAWDVSRYMNVWCFDFADNSTLLGITVPKSYTPTHFPVDETGICITYSALGKRALAADHYPANFDLGRTLTHECGHFFELWHTWGDDGGSCPWDASHKDDGLADTPPEANNSSGNPAYVITGGTVYDACMDSSTINMQPIGIPCLDFMDYTQDDAMHLFTPQQAAVMASQVASGGENYNLTQNPGLLLWPPNTSVSYLSGDASFDMFPNPSSGLVTLVAEGAAGNLQKIEVIDVTGRICRNINVSSSRNDTYSLNLSGMNKGIYLVRCTFASGSFTRKILLQ